MAFFNNALTLEKNNIVSAIFSYTQNGPKAYKQVLLEINSDPCSAEILLKTDSLTSVSDNNTGTFEVLSISPVPATDKLTLLIHSKEAGELKIEIRDRMGVRAYILEEYMNRGENKILLPVSYLQSGMYFLSVKKGEFTKNEKFIVVR